MVTHKGTVKDVFNHSDEFCLFQLGDNFTDITFEEANASERLT